MKLSKKRKIFIAGHNGMVGSAILRHLKKKGYKNIIIKNKNKLNLLNQKKTEKFFKIAKPDYVVIAAARVGGIWANQNYKANFIYENLMIQTNIIHSAYKTGIKKLIFLGSTCIYPKFSKQPIKEEYLLTGELESTNDAYSIAKIAGLKMCEAYNKQYNLNYICLMPTNLYGPNDNFDEKSSHVIPGLIARMHNAKINNSKEFKIWGTGKPLREFLFVNDFADAVQFIIDNNINEKLLNIGSGKEISILDLVKLIKNIINFEGELTFDFEKPDGNPRKLLDSSKINSLGWSPKTELIDGIEKTYNWYKNN